MRPSRTSATARRAAARSAFYTLLGHDASAPSTGAATGRVIPRFAALLVLFLLHPPSAGAASEWELKMDDKEADIRIFSERENERGYPEFRGVTKVNATLSGFVALFKDLDHMPSWAYRIRKAERLKVVSETETYAYTVNSLPPPLWDRDAVIHSVISQDAGTRRMTFRGIGVPDYAPKNDRYVRMPVVES